VLLCSGAINTHIRTGIVEANNEGGRHAVSDLILLFSSFELPLVLNAHYCLTIR
jgi:hypothetical protein